MRLYSRMEQVAPGSKERTALEVLRDNSLKEAFVRGVREPWVRESYAGLKCP